MSDGLKATAERAETSVEVGQACGTTRRAPDADRRRARRRGIRRGVRQPQPGHGCGAGHAPRRRGRRTWTARSPRHARAFDDTDWSTNRALRKRCLEQLQAAIEAEKEDLREELIAEVGCPAMTTQTAQLDWPLAESLRYPARLIDDVRVGTDARRRRTVRRPQRAHRRQGGGRAWSPPITPSNFPIEVILNKLGPALAAGNTVVLKPDPHTPWNATRLGRLIAENTDIPPGVVNVVPTPSNDVAGAAGHRPPRRHGVVHRFHRGRQAADAAGRRHHEADVPRARRQVGADRRSTTPTRRKIIAERGRRLRARRAGLRGDHPDAGAPVAVRRGGRRHHRGVRRGAGRGSGAAADPWSAR